MISTWMSGYERKSWASFGSRIAVVAYSVAVMRIVPDGFSEVHSRRRVILDLFKPRTDVT